MLLTTKKAMDSMFMPCMLEALSSLWFLLVMHRLLAFRSMAGGVALASGLGLRSLAVGLLSDLWLSFLCGTAVGLAAQGLLYTRGTQAAALVPKVFETLLTVAIAGHQAYIEFFHFPIIPYHLTYLTDWRFLSASSGSLLTTRPLALLGCGLVLAWGPSRLKLFTPSSWRHGAIIYTALLALCLSAHAVNINLRVNWFIPDNLMVNAVERLYMRLGADLLPPPLTAADQRWLQTVLHGKNAAFDGAGDAPTSSALFRLLTSDASDAPGTMQEVAVRIKAGFAAATLAHRKPVAMILLLESLRPSETGYFAPTAGPSLTPNLDALAAGGIAFKRAYSTGTVTRGAQEAVFCGYLGSRTTSLMRGSNAAYFACLPDLAASTPNELGARGETFWYHGGDALYDNQEPYWRSHSVHDVLDRDAFPPAAPQTSWGVSDKPFFAAMGRRLERLHAETSSSYLLGLGLTVTNHIPWNIPTDAGPEVLVPRAQGHDSYRTTAYTDAALGQFVAKLRTSGLWQDLLLVIASDHGNPVPPLVDLYPSVSAGNKELPLLSHINLIVTGGLTESALAATPSAVRVREDTVSQAGIASFMAYAVGLPSKQFMADNLFAKQPELPVLSNLDLVLYDHSSEHAFTPSEVSAPATPDMPSVERKGLLYYRAFLHYINSSPQYSPGH